MEFVLGYGDKKEKLIGILKELKDLGFVPSPRVKVKDIDEAIEQFNKDVFTISVCGQIKSGKSTFLNYLIFRGENILPTDTTPSTDVLTKVSYGVENKVIVYFYTQEDWEKLKNMEVDDNGETVNYYEKHLKGEVNKRIKEFGIYPQNVLGTTKEKMGSLDEIKDFLKDYVYVQGKYTPYVSQVNIKVNNNFIKDVVIVDTPGLNDPNELRSQKTEDFVSKSTAVIYLLYVGRAMDKEDHRFIDKVLNFVDSQKLLFAVTKVDTHDDYQNALKYAEESLRNDKQFKRWGLREEDAKVYPLSVIAAIIAEKEEKRIPLTQDEQHIKQSLPDEVFRHKGYVEEFVRAINQKLMQEKGIAVLEKWKKFAVGVIESKFLELSLKREQLIQRISNFQKSMEELQNELKELKESREKFGEVQEDINLYFHRNMNKIKNNLEQVLEDILSEAKVEIYKYIDGKKYNELKNSLPREYYKTLKEKLRLENVENNVVRPINNYLDDYKNKMIEKLEDTNLLKFIPLKSLEIILPFRDIRIVIRDHIYNALTSEIIQSMREKWILLIFPVGTKEVETREKIKTYIELVHEEIKQKLFDSLIKHIRVEIDRILIPFEEAIEEHIWVAENSLEEAQLEYTDRERKIEELKNEIDKLEAEESRLKEKAKQLKERINKL